MPVLSKIIESSHIDLAVPATPGVPWPADSVSFPARNILPTICRVPPEDMLRLKRNLIIRDTHPALG